MISKETVNTVRINGVNTAGQTSVSTVEGNGVTTVKISGGNKALLTDYQDIDGGFVAFGKTTKGGKITDSLLSTIFWAEVVNTACYVLNKVLVTKPHNKTPYELIIGRPPSISFIRPFGCPVTILNTLDPLGKFDGKAEEGFLVGYSVNKAFRVFNTQTRKVEENLHVNFLENKPNVAGQVPNWLFDIDSLANSMNYQLVTARNQANKNAGHQEVNVDTGLKKNVDVGHTKQEKVSTQKYIVFPLWSSISSSYKSSDDKARDNTADDAAGKEGSRTNDLETNNHSYADESVGAKADFNNMEPFTVVSHIPTTRIHSNYTKAQIIRDLMSAVQTKGTIKKSSGEHVMISYIQKKKRINHKDFHNCLFACFLSQHEPTKITQALNDESWVEAMQEELLQFKIQKVWILVDLPYGKKAIGTKWVYQNKKDEREL
nr:putative ribonuclease H-like domain-containing protein [Tanacetum cinerariifolium]